METQDPSYNKIVNHFKEIFDENEQLKKENKDLKKLYNNHAKAYNEVVERHDELEKRLEKKCNPHGECVYERYLGISVKLEEEKELLLEEIAALKMKQMKIDE